jgi:hypothetical protein
MRNMAKTKASPKITTNPVRDNAQFGARTEEDIAKRAYALYEARGREDGHDVDDWLQAEREILEEKNGLALRAKRVSKMITR